MSEQGRKWIVKDGDGRITGPFVTSKILEKIESGDFSGAELIAPHPGGNWIPISKSTEFYDKLLDVLSSEAKQLKKSSAPRTKASTVKRDPVADEDPTILVRRTQSRGQAIRETDVGDDEPLDVETKDLAVQELQPSPDKKPKLKSKAMPIEDDDEKDVIELTDLKELKQSVKKQNAKLPLLLIAVAVLLVLLAFLFQPTQKAAKFKLLAPRRGQPALAEKDVKDKIARGLFNFQKDTFSTYVKAQNDFVAAVEGAPDNPIALGNLCLAYRELWPYTGQDSKDLAVISEVAMQAKRIDPGGFSGAICEIANLLAANRFTQARTQTDTWIVVQSSAAPLYDITAEFFMADDQIQPAVGYYEKARVLWPQWLKPYVQEARARSEQREYPKAMQLLTIALKANPQHQQARAEIGLLEFKQGQFEKALEGLKSALDSGEKIPRQTELPALIALAQIYEKRNSPSKALSYAKRAFALNSGDPIVRDMIARLGGSKDLVDKPQGSEGLYRGDEYVRAGDYVAAQAQYRAAFEADPKNATAALKAGKALWQLNQSSEAIIWLGKAIKADPKLVVSYTTLADYYSQRFDYMSAVATLRKIQQISPKSFEVYRGFALVELRRNNFKGAAEFAKRAFEIYEADPETYIIMANAQVGLANFPDAQRFVQRAIELDQSNAEAQSLYAKVLVDLQGVEPALVFAESLIRTYPQVTDYRVVKGEILLREARLTEAITVLREARSLEPKNKKAALTLGKALQDQGSNQDALRSFLEAAEMDPSDASPLFYAGQLYASESRTYADAIKMFERVLKINPRYPRAHVQLGNTYLKMGRGQDALNEAQQEKAINPELIDAYVLAAEAHYSMRQFTNCAAEYQAAVTKQQAPTIIYVKMARCYRLSGSNDSALSLLNQAKDREDGNPEIYKELGATYHVKGQREEALSAYYQYLKLAPASSDRDEIQGYIDRIEQGDMSFGEKEKP